MKNLSELLKKKAVIFDLDGTLIDSIGIWNAVDEDLIRTLGGTLPEVPLQVFRDTMLAEVPCNDSPFLHYCARLGAHCRSPLSPEEIERARYALADSYLEEKIDYKLGVRELLQLLRHHEIRLAIATTTRARNLEIYRHRNCKLLAAAPIDEYFDCICCRDDIVRTKPDPEIYLLALKRLSLPAADCVAVEDTLEGVRAAKAAGLDTIAVYERHSQANRAKIAALADAYVESCELLVRMLCQTKEEV